jgi:hypothetical protein
MWATIMSEANKHDMTVDEETNTRISQEYHEDDL